MAKKKVFSIGHSLSEGLEETIAAAHNYSGELRIDVIPLRKIEVDPENPRQLAITFADIYNGISETDPFREQKRLELENLKSLSNSIKEQGVINPIVVYKHNQGYRLVAGERRTLASLLANKQDIQAKILDGKPQELKIRMLQWIENIERSDLSLWERLNNLEKIMHAYASQNNKSPEAVTVTELSQLIGCSKAHAVNLRSVLHAEDDLRNLIETNQIKNMEKAALIAGITAKELRVKAINECIAGATLKKLKSIADEARSKQVIRRIVERRGRQTQVVSLGKTKNIQVAKLIFDAILNNAALSHIKPHYKNIDFNDHRMVAATFKNLIKKLEELHA